MGFCTTFSGGPVLAIGFLITQSREQVTGLFALGPPDRDRSAPSR